MKISYIKKIKKCFGKKSQFFKESIKDCPRCQFKQRCLLQINGGNKNEETKN